MLAQAEALNMRLVGQTNLNGHGDCMHINLKDGFAFVAHMGESRVGTSVVDVSDPSRPRVVTQLETPVGTHSHKVQVVGDVLLVNYERSMFEPQATSWQGGLKVFDVSSPTQPREIAFLAMPGKGVHRMTYWEPPYAYMSGSDEGLIDQFLVIVDLSEPSRPREVGRWWFPGQNTGAGETPSWTPTQSHGAAAGAKRIGAPPSLDPRRPRVLRLVGRGPGHPRHLGQIGPDAGQPVGLRRRGEHRHAYCPASARPRHPSRDRRTACARLQRHADARPRGGRRRRGPSAGHFRVPRARGRLLSARRALRAAQPAQMRPGTSSDPNTIYVTWFNAGLRVIDISDAANPREIAYYVPEAPPGRSSIQFNDVLVGSDGLVYASDRFTGGLYIMERTG